MSGLLMRVFAYLTLAISVIAVTAGPAGAQQTCYAYDGPGRLTGVIDQNNDAAFYDYDAVGNILSIRRASPSGPVTIYAVYPLSGAPGHQFEIFGVGLSATPDQNQVTVGGVSARVASTVPCTLIVDVPPDGITGQVHVTTPSGQATSAEAFLVSRFAISGTAFSVLPNITVEYSVISNGCNDPAVTWRVNGIAGGSASIGLISSNGLYTSPPAIPTPPYVIIRADSVVCPTLFDEKTLDLVTSSTTFVVTAASAAYGVPPAVMPPQTVMASATVRYGSPPAALPPGTVVASASAASVPVVRSVVPSSAKRGSAYQVTIAGDNLAGATGLTFLGTSAPDTAISVSNIAVDAANGRMTATISIAGTATTGNRTIRIDRAGGNSTAVPTTTNVFTVLQ